MNQDPGGDFWWKNPEGRKSRDTVPLRKNIKSEELKSTIVLILLHSMYIADTRIPIIKDIKYLQLL
jgi:hypothetical protein